MAIESSCDETACAVVKDGVYEISHILTTSSNLHEETGGVIPEIAARKQVEFIVPVISKCLNATKDALGLTSFEEVAKTIDAIAVTKGPGLAGSLIVGIEAAKTLAMAWQKPLIPVNHLMGHVYATFIKTNNDNGIQDTSEIFPAVALVVSGGHTDLILMRGHNNIEYLGGTLDDAAGEAFDKTARLLGLSNYLGGVLLSKKATEFQGYKPELKLPRPLINQANLDFSFSGLKTAVKRAVEQNKYSTTEIAFEFEEAVVEVLIKKSIKALIQTKAKTFIMAGGVSANTKLRDQMKTHIEKTCPEVTSYFSPTNLCGDNAVYIASRAFFQTQGGSLDTECNYASIRPEPSLGIDGV